MRNVRDDFSCSHERIVNRATSGRLQPCARASSEGFNASEFAPNFAHNWTGPPLAHAVTAGAVEDPHRIVATSSDAVVAASLLIFPLLRIRCAWLWIDCAASSLSAATLMLSRARQRTSPLGILMRGPTQASPRCQRCGQPQQTDHEEEAAAALVTTNARADRRIRSCRFPPPVCFARASPARPRHSEPT